jgi:signal transduction histidine kinase
MHLSLVALGLIIPVNLLLGSLVMARGYKVRSNQYFSLSIFSICLWALGDMLLLGAKSSPVVWTGYYLFYIGPLFTVFFLTLFTIYFKSTTKQISKSWPAILFSTTLLLSLVIGIWKWVLVEGININYGSNNTVVVHKPGWIIYTFFFSTLFSASYVILFRRIAKSKGTKRAQAQYVLAGVFLTSFFAYVTNLLLPLQGVTQYIWLGPVFTIFYVTITSAAIIKHHLFDIRLAVARSVAYLSSLVVLSTIYGLVVFSIAKYVFGLEISLTSQIFLSAATGVAGLLFQRPIKVFDKLTNSIFYRDAYDPQELFDHLNRVLVSSLDLNYLLRHASRILADNLKAEYVLIGLKSDTKGQYRMAGTEKMNFSVEDIERLRSLTPKYHQSVIVSDYLDEAHSDIKYLLEKNNIAVIVRLTPDVNRKEEGLGYIVLGAKKSGNPYSNQDIRVLDTVANELIIAIQNALHFEEIQQFNVTLQSRVNDATRQLRRTNQKLEALDETKDDFISMASHQLRTPLTSVKGYLSMVLEGDAGKINDTQKKMLNQAFISSQRMVYLIADLLNVSRLKTGKFIIDWAPVDLSKVIQEEISQLTETAKSRGITLTYKKPADFPVVQLDETKTRQVIMNFVDNAIYYTPTGGHIAVELEDHVVSIELKVVDDGIGVPKAEQHHLFTKFYRARNAQRARPDGTGLGLFMAKKVVLAQGGSIIFESKEGKGSTFGFTFPKVALERLSAAAPQPQHAPKTLKTPAKK